MNLLARRGMNAARGQNIDREVYRDGARMKEIKRPEIDGSSGKINAARGLREDNLLGINLVRHDRSVLSQELTIDDFQIESAISN